MSSSSSPPVFSPSNITPMLSVQSSEAGSGSEHRYSIDDEHEHDSGPLLSHYRKVTSSIRKDYSTVDWYYSKYQLVRVRRLINRENSKKGFKGRILNAFISAQGWFLLLIVGIATAASASFIHLVAAWLGDIKTGYCSENFFSTRRVCCMEFIASCPSWRSWSEVLLSEPSPSSEAAFAFNFFIYILFSVLFGVLSCYLVLVFSPSASGSGIAEVKVILGGFVIKQFLGIRTLFIKSMSLILSVSSGLSLGKEGPLVHVAACWGNILSRRFTKYANEVKRREILSASVAAGVSAAFGAPLGGVLFSLECVSSYFPSKTMWRSFLCAITAAIVLQYADPFQTGKLVQFAIRTQSPWYWVELFPFILLGILGGFLGALFVRLHVYITSLRHKYTRARARARARASLAASSPLYSSSSSSSSSCSSRVFRVVSHPLFEVFFLSLLTALIQYPIFFTRGSSTTLLAQLFSSCQDQSVVDERDVNAGADSVVNALCNSSSDAASNLSLLLVAGLLKYFLTVLTYGAPLPCGVFVPALTTGACLGRVVGWGMQLWYESVGDSTLFNPCAGKSICVSPNIYAVIGATALLGGITRMTVSLAVIMFEVTGGLEYIVPIMVAVVCSRWIGDAFGQPLYNKIIEHNGWPYIDADLESIDFNLPHTHGVASSIMASNPICLTAHTTSLHALRDLLHDYPYHGFPIVRDDVSKHCMGFIARSEIECILENVDKEQDNQHSVSSNSSNSSSSSSSSSSGSSSSRSSQSAAVDDFELGGLEGITEFSPVYFSDSLPPTSAPHINASEDVDKHPIFVLPDTPLERVVCLFISLGLRYVLVSESTEHQSKLVGIIKKKDLLLALHEKNQIEI